MLPAREVSALTTRRVEAQVLTGARPARRCYSAGSALYSRATVDTTPGLGLPL